MLISPFALPSFEVIENLVGTKPSVNFPSVAARGLLRYQERFGFSPHSLVCLSGEASAWESRCTDGAVAYLRVGKTWLCSEPLAAAADLLPVAREFIAFARSSGALPSFVPVTSRFASVAIEGGMGCIPIGISPYFDLASWKPSGRRAHALRSGIHQAARAHVTVQEVTLESWPEDEMEGLEAAWGATRKSPLFGWVFAPDRHFLGYRRLFTARDSGGKLVAFATASPLPARNSFYLEDIQRDPLAPKGATDLLFVTALESLREHGAELVTLGTVPLKGVDAPHALRRGMCHAIATKALDVIANHGESVYNFEGVHTFKSRLSPSWWEHEYAVAPAGNVFAAPRIALAALRGIMPSGILSTVLGFKGKFGKKLGERVAI